VLCQSALRICFNWACVAIHNSRKPRQTEKPPGSTCPAGGYAILIGAGPANNETMTTDLSVANMIRHLLRSVNRREPTSTFFPAFPLI
jgi:hypothetical protein